MNTDLLLVLALLGAAIAMFARNRPRMDVVALLMIAALPFTGIVTMTEALAGFSDPNIILIALLFVLGDGLVRTGVARRLGDWIHRKAAGSEVKVLALLMLAVGFCGAVMSSTAIVAIFIPVALRISKNTGLAASKLMMPLSMAGLISGMMTLVATAPNLIVQSELLRQEKPVFHFLTITPFGVTILFLGVGYMLAVRRWLPDAPGEAGRPQARPTFREWIERYRLEENEKRVRVLPGSPWIGRKLEELALGDQGMNLLAIERVQGRRRILLRPGRGASLLANDVLLLDVREMDGDPQGIAGTCGGEMLPLGATHRYLMDHMQDLGMIEAIVPAESGLVGKTAVQARLRSETGLTLIGLRRGQTVFGRGFLEEPMHVGDTLLLTGFWDDIARLRDGAGDVLPLSLPAEMDDVLPAHDRAPHALAVMALVVGLMVTGLVRNVHAALIGCLLMGGLRCVDLKSAYRSINWQTLVLIVGMMPFSMALQRTGGVDVAVQALMQLPGEQAPRLMLAALFVITALIGMWVSNTATAVLMAPIAIHVADALAMSPLPFAMAVALGASTAFMTPISSPVNTLVLGPGNYRFIDFVRLGVPFSILVLIASVSMIPWLLPF